MDAGAADEPLVVGFDGEHRDQAKDRGVVGEDADDIGAPADLAVEALQRVGASELGPVLGRTCEEGQDIVFGFLEQAGDLWQAGSQLSDGGGQAGAGLLGVGGGEGRPISAPRRSC